MENALVLIIVITNIMITFTILKYYINSQTFEKSNSNNRKPCKTIQNECIVILVVTLCKKAEYVHLHRRRYEINMFYIHILPLPICQAVKLWYLDMHIRNIQYSVFFFFFLISPLLISWTSFKSFLKTLIKHISQLGQHPTGSLA